MSSPTCPFCHAGISAHLAAHGGPCPSCFAEIPGEEAATNPGEEVLAQQKAEAIRRVEQRQRRPLLLAVPVVAAIVGAAVWALIPEPQVELVFDEEFVIEREFAKWDGTQAVDAADEGAAKTKRPRAGGQAGATASLQGPGDVPTGSTDDGVAEGGGARRPGFTPPPEGDGVRDIGGPTAGGTASGGDDLDVDLGRTQRKAAMLESKEDIQKAVKDMLRSRVPRLQQCFERALNTTPGLAGTWKLQFVVGTDGKASEPRATGQQMQDAGFEGCIVKEMAAWGIYGQLAKPWPVSLPVNFKNEG